MIVWFHVALLYAAACAGTSWILTHHNSDTVLPALISIVDWEPYYWGDNRFGMLVPLLATPIRDYATNLMFQNALTVWSGLVAVWFIARLVSGFRDGRTGMMTAALVLCIAFAVFREHAALVLLIQSNYLPSLALLLAALSLSLSRGVHPVARYAGVAIMLFGSFWTNFANIVFGFSLFVLWPPSPEYPWRRRALACALVAACYGFSMATAAAYSPQIAHREFLPVSEYWTSLSKLLADASRVLVNMPAVIALLSAALLAVAFQRPWRQSRLIERWSHPAVVLIIASLIYIGAAGASAWVKKNNWDSRYISSQLLVIVCASASVLVKPLAGAVVQRLGQRTAPTVACLLVVAMATSAFGFPSRGRGTEILRKAMSRDENWYAHPSCTHLVGDYWRVWKLEFHDRLIGRKPPRFAVTDRAEWTRPEWNAGPERDRTYCSASDDPSIEHSRRVNAVPQLEPAGQYGATLLFRTTAFSHGRLP